MGFFDVGLREGNRFLAMLVDHARNAVAAIEFLETMLDHASAEATEQLGGMSRQSTEARSVLVDELHRTFVTPLDREDIYNLSEAFEKMVTYAWTTLEEMHLLHVAPDAAIRGMVTLVREQAQDLHEAMQRLAKNPRVASDHANRIHDKEREVERLYRAAIRDLFAGAADPAALPGILYRREVYRHISNMADRAVSAANVLGMVVMKIA
ncbi:MAG TPA: DUF47 family protein [Usitatibacter sp.]|nr:DUF47 family protein [Usitatibacter sp.]